MPQRYPGLVEEPHSTVQSAKQEEASKGVMGAAANSFGEVRDEFLDYRPMCLYAFLIKTNRSWISKEEMVLRRGAKVPLQSEGTVYRQKGPR